MGGIDVVGTHSPATCSLLLCMNAILHLFHGHHCPEAESLLGIDVVGTHSPATCSLLLCMNAILHLFHGICFTDTIALKQRVCWALTLWHSQPRDMLSLTLHECNPASV